MLGRIGAIASLRALTAAVLIAIQAGGTGKDEMIREKLRDLFERRVRLSDLPGFGPQGEGYPQPRAGLRLD